MMDIYTSEWNKETVMAHATRLLHITQELAVDAVTKYTKKQYARLGFGSSSLMAVSEEDELALVQEAYTIAWKYLNLALEYTPIARTTLKLHTHHGALGNFIGTLGQDNRVLIGDNQGIYVCSGLGSSLGRWYEPRTGRTSARPDDTTAYTGRVLTGTRACIIKSANHTDLNAMTDIERMSLKEPTSFRLSIDYWWLTWYPKQQYMMIHKSESTTSCEHPSEVTWSYRVAPSSYRHFVVHKSQDWSTDDPADTRITANFRDNLPSGRHQTDYAYEVRNERGGFGWVKVKGTLPVYKCPPVLLKYFNDSFPHVQFEGDESLAENPYAEILDSIQDPREVGGYVVLESAVLRTTMYYLQLEFVAVPLAKLFPVRQDSLYSRTYVRQNPRQHSSGQMISSAAEGTTWVYSAKKEYDLTGKPIIDYPDIQRHSRRPPLELTVGDVLYYLYTNIEPARNQSGLVLFPDFTPFVFSTPKQAFNDEPLFTPAGTTFLGVKYTPEGEAYAILVDKSSQTRSWTVLTPYTMPALPITARVIQHAATGIDMDLLYPFIKYRTTESGDFKYPYLAMTDYSFKVKLSQRTYGNFSGGTSGIETTNLGYADTARVHHRFWVYAHESEQYQYMLNTPTGNSGFYKPELPADTHTFLTTSEVFINGS